MAPHDSLLCRRHRSVASNPPYERDALVLLAPAAKCEPAAMRRTPQGGQSRCYGDEALSRSYGFESLTKPTFLVGNYSIEAFDTDANRAVARLT